MTTEQTSIFAYVDQDEYGLPEFDDMINGSRMMMHFPRDYRDSFQSSLTRYHYV